MNTPNTPTPGLMPCPFCGSTSIDAHGWTSLTASGPACDDCGASAGEISANHEENVTAWNTRHRQSVSHETLAGEGLIRRIEYILDETATAKQRRERRAHLTNHDLRTILAALHTQGGKQPNHTAENAVERVARVILHDKIHAEARERHLNDATQAGYEYHVVVVAAEHAVRAVLSTTQSSHTDLLKALQFYANRSTWKVKRVSFGELITSASQDRGHRARAAIAQHKGQSK